jgi:hypothetical protein
MVPAMAKAHTSRNIKPVEEGFASAADPDHAGLAAPKRGTPGGHAPSLRDRLAEFFRAGRNGSDRELAVMFGASVGSISVYRCQLKKLGVGVASPPAVRAAAKDRRAGTRKVAPLGKRSAGGGTGGRSGAKGAPPQGESSALSMGEIDQVLMQNIETELGLIVERYPDLARPVANVQQTVRLLLKLHR